MNHVPSERGSALIEFSLLITVLMLLLLGVVDFSLAIRQAMTVNGAAAAGARYGAAEGNANNTANMASAALNAANGVSGMTATATTWCSCSAGGTVVNCSITCNTYDLPIQYVQVQTAATLPLLFRFPNLPLSIGINGSATMRAR
jgi:Flp pilus assembly protein TadG